MASGSPKYKVVYYSRGLSRHNISFSTKKTGKHHLFCLRIHSLHASCIFSWKQKVNLLLWTFIPTPQILSHVLFIAGLQVLLNKIYTVHETRPSMHPSSFKNTFRMTLKDFFMSACNRIRRYSSTKIRLAVKGLLVVVFFDFTKWTQKVFLYSWLSRFPMKGRIVFCHIRRHLQKHWEKQCSQTGYECNDIFLQTKM